MKGSDSFDDRLKRLESLLSLTKNVLNLDEVCLLTGFSRSHIYKLTCYKKIPFYKQSKHLFFDRLEIENWLKSSKYLTSEELEKQASTYVALNQNRSIK